MNREQKIRATWDQNKHRWREEYGDVFRAYYYAPVPSVIDPRPQLTTEAYDVYTFTRKEIGVTDPVGQKFRLCYVECEEFIITGYLQDRYGNRKGIFVDEIKTILSDIQLFESRRKIEEEKRKKQYAKEKREAYCQTNQSGNREKRNSNC